MKSSPLNYIINIHIEQIMYINVCIPMLITHVKENRELKKKRAEAVKGVCDEI